jgi:hypothetical protein
MNFQALINCVHENIKSLIDCLFKYLNISFGIN